MNKNSDRRAVTATPYKNSEIEEIGGESEPV